MVIWIFFSDVFWGCLLLHLICALFGAGFHTEVRVALVHLACRGGFPELLAEKTIFSPLHGVTSLSKTSWLCGSVFMRPLNTQVPSQKRWLRARCYPLKTAIVACRQAEGPFLNKPMRFATLLSLSVWNVYMKVLVTLIILSNWVKSNWVEKEEISGGKYNPQLFKLFLSF